MAPSLTAVVGGSVDGWIACFGAHTSSRANICFIIYTRSRREAPGVRSCLALPGPLPVDPRYESRLVTSVDSPIDLTDQWQ